MKNSAIMCVRDIAHLHLVSYLCRDDSSSFYQCKAAGHFEITIFNRFHFLHILSSSHLRRLPVNFRHCSLISDYGLIFLFHVQQCVSFPLTQPVSCTASCRGYQFSVSLLLYQWWSKNNVSGFLSHRNPKLHLHSFYYVWWKSLTNGQLHLDKTSLILRGILVPACSKITVSTIY